ncbi:neuraminidase-like domain-containing protein [Methylomonas sp. MO1]|uniref:neuraminidase-like domain-containing protein n=1 Tax=Methylomonas sp. MO1 TaxID=3073619 RepID=UPI0028A2E843|nr:neuraminidase-like domain-containing protein [Methylomonas sp. MO1]MDT4292018.1 neuraminidase-like domain-containing protein [Methylomonas sp. MO1]
MAEKIIKVGMMGNDVSALHQTLLSQGLTIPQSEAGRGFFGPATRNAVLEIQTRNQLPTTGQVDAATAAAIAKQPSTVAIAESAVTTNTMPSGIAAGNVGIGSTLVTGISAANSAAALGSVRIPDVMIPNSPPTNPSPGGGVSSSPTQVVSGSIVLEHGLPASKVKLNFYQRGLGGELTLVAGNIETTESGEYSTVLSGASNLEIHAIDSNNREVQLSATKFDLAADERIDLIAPSAVQPLAAEFKRLTEAVAPHAGEKMIGFKNAIERDGRTDFSFLAGKTGWDPGALALASTAFSLSDHINVPAEGLYAMARSGLPMDPRKLAQLRTETVANVLRRASAAGMVDAASIDSNIAAFREFAGNFKFNNRISGAVSAPKDFVSSAQLSDADKALFTSVIKEEATKNIWERAKAVGVSDAGLERLQIQGKLAYLTFNNAELSANLNTKISASILELIELGYYEESKWKDLLNELSSGDENKLSGLVPSVIIGQSLEQRVDAYASELSRRVRQMDTHAVTVDRIATAKMDAVPDADNVGRFLKNATNLGFRLGKTPLSNFIASNSSAVWKEIAPEMQESALATVRKLSSLYSVSPDDESMNALMAAGFSSATEIARHDFDAFHERIRIFFRTQPKAGDLDIRKSIYWKAKQQAATIFNVFDGLKRLNTVSYAPGSSPDDTSKRDDQIVATRKKLAGLFPTLETLFGSVDYCECNQCQSVLSPAAYLVDLLAFIDPDEEAWATIKGAYKVRIGVDYTKSKPFDALNARRPDIKNIALTCENTNVALPHIDLINEILEQLMMADQSAPEIEAYDVGEASSQDLLAEPQNILWSAYVGDKGKPGLRDLVYPITLPFDLPIEMVRTFLNQLGIPLWRLRELLVRPSSLSASAAARADGWMDVWFERLGFSPADISALTKSDEWYLLFGYTSAADALVATETVDGVTRPSEKGLRNAKTLARRLGVSYEELVELIRTRFINPEIEVLISLNRLGVDAHLLDRYFGEGTPLSPASRSELEASLSAQGIQVDELRFMRTGDIRRSTLLLQSPSVGCDFSLTSLAFDQEPSYVEGELSLRFLKLNAFVRLYKKLGWDIHELDRALMAVMPSVSSLTVKTWPDAIKTALCYLAHVEEIRESFEDRVTREEILVFWSDIPTTGISCLYERLFMGRAVLDHEVFKKRLGHVLTETVPIADHVDGIRQALQLSEDEIEPILNAAGVNNRNLSIANLSILMRHAILARGLEVSITELLALLSLSERKPLSAIDTAPLTEVTKDIPWNETLAFVKELDLIRETGVEIAFIERVCRYRGIADEPSPDNDPARIAILALSHEGSPDPQQQKILVDKQNLLLVQTLAAQLTAPDGLISNLLSNTLLDETGKPLIENGFSEPGRITASLRRLRATLDLLKSLEITDTELSYLRGVSQALNLNDLPIEEVTSDAKAREIRSRLSVWLELAAVRKEFGRSERILAVLSAARPPLDTDHPIADREKVLHEAVAALTGLKVAWLEPALYAIGAKTIRSETFEVPALADPAALRRTIESLKCFTRIGLKPADVVQFASAPIDDVVARKVRSSLKGRYSPSAWRRLVKPIYDSLRKKQRDALVSHLTHVMEGEKPKYGDTPEKLFEYLLLDPGMEPVVVASRIQAAISSVQLFVQRCLMNLEPEGVDPQIIDAKRWEWVRRYRVWEVNRKMFIWPENWLDPEFRDDKSHIFRELEGKLLEGDVNDDLVRTALFDYLKGLEQIARLEMLTMYFEPGPSADSSIIHVLGRTPHGPHKYFYRQVSHGMWTPWEPIDVGIEGAHLVLTLWRGRMYLFWTAFFEETKENPNTPTTFKPSADSVEASKLRSTTKVKVQLHWVEKISGKWVNRSSISGFVETDFDGLKATTDSDKEAFFVRAVLIQNAKGIEDDDLEIHIKHNEGKGHRFRFYSKLAPPASILSADAPPSPPFANIKKTGSKWKGSNSLQAQFVSAVEQNSQTGSNDVKSGSYTILERGGDFKLLVPSNDTLPVPSQIPPSGVGRPSGFIFGPQNAQHVVYRSSDGSIYDLFWTRNGWFYQTPSADAERADPTVDIEPAVSDPYGYAIDDRGMICIAYAGATKVYELVWSQLDSIMDDNEQMGTGWQAETVYQASNPDGHPEGKPYGGVFLPQRGIVFRTKDERLLVTLRSPLGNWDTKELLPGIPKINSDPTGFVVTKTESGITTILSRHIIYLGDDGDIHELQSDFYGQNWSHKNITESIVGVVKPAPRSNPAAYTFQSHGTHHVVYRGIDDRIHELWGNSDLWNYNPIGANSTKAKGDPVGYATEGFSEHHVVYRGENDQVVELWWLNGWHEHILTNTVTSAPKAGSNLAGYSFEAMQTQHVVYFDENGNPQELYWNDGSWHHGVYWLQNPFPPNSLAALAAPFFYESSTRDHTFFVEPYVVETTVHEWTDWIVTTSEYVEPKIYIPLHIIIPNAVDIAPSTASIIKIPLNVSKFLFDARTVIRTPKGTISPLAHSEAFDANSLQLAKTISPSMVANVSEGLQPALVRTIREFNLKGVLR